MQQVIYFSISSQTYTCGCSNTFSPSGELYKPTLFSIHFYRDHWTCRDVQILCCCGYELILFYWYNIQTYIKHSICTVLYEKPENTWLHLLSLILYPVLSMLSFPDPKSLSCPIFKTLSCPEDSILFCTVLKTLSCPVLRSLSRFVLKMLSHSVLSLLENSVLS